MLYRDRDLLQRQYFLYDDWPGGLYGSATTAGTRPAAPIAGAWAAINHLGADGYLRLAERGARRHPALPRRASTPSTACAITGDPTCRVFEFGSRRRRRHRRGRRRDGRPGLAPRPPAGRPAPDGVAVPRRRSPTSSSPTSPTRSPRPRREPGRGRRLRRRRPDARSSRAGSPFAGAVLTGGRQPPDGPRQGAARGRRPADGRRGWPTRCRGRRPTRSSCVGGDGLEALGGSGWRSVPDDRPGRGPARRRRSPRLAAAPWRPTSWSWPRATCRGLDRRGRPPPGRRARPTPTTAAAVAVAASSTAAVSGCTRRGGPEPAGAARRARSTAGERAVDAAVRAAACASSSVAVAGASVADADDSGRPRRP